MAPAAMDVTVTDAKGLPERSYISFRVGDMRKQSQYKAGEPFRFEVQDPPRHVHVDVFQKVGSAQVSLSDLSRTGKAGEIKDEIQVPRGDGLDAAIQLGLQVNFSEAAHAKERKRRPKPIEQDTLKAKRYLDGHQVGQVLQDMVQSLLRDRPEDPYPTMLNFLKEAAVSKPKMPVKPKLPEDKPEKIAQAVKSAPPSDFPADGSSSLPDLSAHHNILATVLKAQPGLYEALKDVRTPLGVPLATCVKPGVDNKGHQMIKAAGLVAGDTECYSVFAEVFEPVLCKFYGLSAAKAPPPDLTQAKISSAPVDPRGTHVHVTQICGSRNLVSIRMLPAISREERCEVERIVTKACFKVAAQGDYFPVCGSNSYLPKPGGMTKQDGDELKLRGYLIEQPDSAVSISSGLTRDWPEARGTFMTADDSLAVVVNEFDHMKVISSKKGPDMQTAFVNFCSAEASLNSSLEEDGYNFGRSDRFGFLTTSASDVGTALQATAVVKLPLLSGTIEFKQLFKKLGLTVRHTSNAEFADSSPTDGIWDISSGKRFGSTEVEQVNILINGCRKLVDLETRLEEGVPVDFDAELAAAMPDTAVVETPEVPYPGFPVSQCPFLMPDLTRHYSLAADVFKANPAIYESLKNKKSGFDVPFAKCVKTAFDNRGHPMIKTMGAVCADASCYDAFREFFVPLLRLRHVDFDPTTAGAQPTQFDASKVVGETIDVAGTGRVISTKVVASRNFAHLRFAPACSQYERRAAEQAAIGAFVALPSDLQGEYFELQGLRTEEEAKLRKQGFLFEMPDSEVLLSSGFGRQWPDARGVFVAKSNKLQVRINEEDHLRIVSSQQGDALKEAFAELCRFLQAIEVSFQGAGYSFAHDERLGFLGCCPSNLGTALAVRVTLRIPLLGAYQKFRAMCTSLKLQVRGKALLDEADPSSTAHSEGLWEITNLQRLGSSEVDQVNAVIQGCRVLLECEDRLAKGVDIPNDVSILLPRMVEQPDERLKAKSIHALMNAYDLEDSDEEDEVDEGKSRAKAQSALMEIFEESSDADDGSKPPDELLKAKSVSALMTAFDLIEEDEESTVSSLPPFKSEFSCLPGLGIDDYPGFDPNECPEKMPDLSKHHTILADVLKKDPTIYDKLKDVRTVAGVSLARCIKPGIDIIGHPMIKSMGIVAGDADCYDVFKDLFDAVIRKRNPDVSLDEPQPSDLDAKKVKRTLTPNGHVVSVEIRAQRNIRGFRMPPAAERKERVEVERILSKALLFGVPGSYKGEYNPLQGSCSYVAKPNGMDAASQDELEKAGLLFQEPDQGVVLASGSGRCWPEARGVFASLSGNFAAWINEEDHLKIIMSDRTGADLRALFGNFCAVEESISQAIKAAGYDFAQTARYGYLTSCPSNLGTSLHVEAVVKLPLLSSKKDFRNLCKRLKLQARAAAKAEAKGTWIISNSSKLGSSEVEQVSTVIEAVRALVAAEQKLELGEDVDLGSIVVDAPTTEVEYDSDDGNDYLDIPGLGADEMPGFPADVCPEALPDLSNHSNIVSDIFRKNLFIYERLRLLKTKLGVSLAKCIKPGMDARGHPMIRTVGAIAGDPQCYELFGELFNEIFHRLDQGGGPPSNPISNLDPSKVDTKPIDASGKFLISARLKCSRNLIGICFPPAVSREQRCEAEMAITKALASFSGDLKGEYLPLDGSDTYAAMPDGMEPEQEDELEEEGLLFQEPDSSLMLSSGVGRYWPEARGIFVNPSRSVAVWVNEEDHVRFIVTTKKDESGKGLHEVFDRFCKAERNLKQALIQQGYDYAVSQRLGFLTADPSNVGIGGLKINLLMRLPLLGAHAKLKTTCKSLGVFPRPVNSKEHGAIWSIHATAKRRMSEVDFIHQVTTAGQRLVELEERLERGEKID